MPTAPFVFCRQQHSYVHGHPVLSLSIHSHACCLLCAWHDLQPHDTVPRHDSTSICAPLHRTSLYPTGSWKQMPTTSLSVSRHLQPQALCPILFSTGKWTHMASALLCSLQASVVTNPQPLSDLCRHLHSRLSALRGLLQAHAHTCSLPA